MKTCRFKFEKTISKSGERWGAFIPWRRTIFVKPLRLVSVVSEHYDRNYSSPNNGFKFHGRAPCFRL